METIWQDLRFAARTFRRTARFDAIAIIALALGIGANTAIFSLVNAALLRPLSGVAVPERLVMLERTRNDRLSNFGYPDYSDYRDQSTSFDGLAAHCGTPLTFVNGATERLRGDLVTGNYFSVLGVQPAIGRLISNEDDKEPGGSPVAVLSYALWVKSFGSNPDIAGQSIRLNNSEFTIVGVAPRDFGGTDKGVSYDIWIPIKMQVQAMPRTLGRNWFNDRSAGWLDIFGKLKSGRSLESAQTELSAISSRLEQAYPDTNSASRVSLYEGLGLDSVDRGSLRSFLGVLFATVGLLLLIACTNAANLSLLRAAARRRETAVKLALGATRARLIQQLLTESLALSLIAGIAGALLAPWITQLILGLQQPAYALRGMNVGTDGRVLLFTAALSITTGVVFGLVPALLTSKTDLVVSLKDGSPSSGRTSRTQRLLVIAQVAVSIVLLIGATLGIRTMQKTLTLDRGFDVDNLVLMSVDLTIQNYDESKGKDFYKQLLARIEATPGVISASLAKTVPPNDWSDRVNVFLPGGEPPPEVLRARDDLGLRVEANRIAPHYFKTLGIRINEGREFDYSDGSGSPPVAIINENLAQRLWPGESAIGKRLAVPFWREPRPAVEIVGVVRNTKHRSLLEEMPMIVYLPELQAYDGRATVVARVDSNPSTFIPMLREAVAEIDRNLPLYAVKTMNEQVSSTLWRQRMAASLIGLFGFLALFLAAIGLYAVISHSVSLRIREIGIRIALGARGVDVTGMIIREAIWLAVSGVVLGIAGALILTRLMSSVLYGISPTDPASFAAASVVLTGVALVAGLLPARRASRVDPMISLRCE